MTNTNKISAKESKEQKEKIQCYKYHYGKWLTNGFINKEDK